MTKVESMSDVLGKLIHAFDVDAPQLVPAGIQPSENLTGRIAFVQEVDDDFKTVAVRELGLVAAGLTLVCASLLAYPSEGVLRIAFLYIVEDPLQVLVPARPSPR